MLNKKIFLKDSSINPYRFAQTMIEHLEYNPIIDLFNNKKLRAISERRRKKTIIQALSIINIEEWTSINIGLSKTP